MVTVFGQIDTGELAARLNSINNFDRRGNTIWMDDFEASTLNKWYSSLTPPSTATLSACYALSGSNSLKLLHRAVINDDITVVAHCSPPVPGKSGFEFAFTRHEHIKYLDAVFQVFTGTIKHFPMIRFDFENSIIYYYASDNTLKVLTAVFDLYYTNLLFHRCKLVVDTSTGRYVRLILNNQYFDMSDLFYYQTPDATQEETVLLFKSRNETAAANYMYIDNVIVTQNEP